jgi:predicted AAA+ superfamily ATPase
MKKTFKRAACRLLVGRIHEPRRFLQVVSGPRQSGKTTLVRQAVEEAGLPFYYASADEPALRGSGWIEQQWEAARTQTNGSKRADAVLVLDEIQKIPGWSETVKRLWDEDTAAGISLKVVLLGSSPLLVQRGLTESLTGRFETINVTHWSFKEMREAFGWSLEQYFYFGGYPGAAPLINDFDRWRRYVADSLVETTVSRDILLRTRGDKPALLRQLFHLGCVYSGQIVSFQKLLGQLQDAGNTVTLAHYLELLSGAGMLTGLGKYAGSKLRQRGSSPKLLAMNTALITAQSGLTFEEAKKESDFWGRIVESAVGAHILNSTRGTTMDVFYWREGAREVDFILQKGKSLAAIEVKSGRKRENLSGIQSFSDLFHPKRVLLIGKGGIPIERFLESDLNEWVG